MRLEPVSFGPALHVAERMREWDRREIMATRWTEDPGEVAADAALGGPFGWVAFLGEEPVAVIGAGPLHPGVWQVWMFASDKFSKVRFSMTRFTKRVIIPAMRRSGAHRAECRSMVGHVEAQRWLESFGARCEAVLAGYGRGGEDFLLYATDWRRVDVRSQELPGAGGAAGRTGGVVAGMAAAVPAGGEASADPHPA
jgi:hypothetical protein